MADPPIGPSSDDAESAATLVVEPDSLVRTVILDYLRDCGCKVIEDVSVHDVRAVVSAGRRHPG